MTTADKQWIFWRNDVDNKNALYVPLYTETNQYFFKAKAIPLTLLDQLRRDAINSQRENLIAEAHTQFMHDVDKEVLKAKKELLDEYAKQDLALYETIRLYYNLKAGHGLTLSLFKQKVLELINNQKELRAKTLGENVK